MKIFKLMAVALVAMIGLNSCSKDCDHTDYDHSADLVGTWTCLQADFAEALVISADGKVVSTGVAEGEYWEDVNGTIAINEGTITLTFEDGDNFEGHFDIIPGIAFSIYNDKGDRLVFNYCANDLSDEIVGMWVFQDGEDAAIQTFTEDGKLFTTAPASDLHSDNLVQHVSEYKVVGDIRFQIFLEETIDHDKYLPARMVYTPNGTTLGDILSFTFYVPTNNGFVERTGSNLRIKQSLDLAEQKYDYIKTYVSNVKGEDKDIEFMGLTFNFAKMNGSELDKLLKAILFNVEFPDAETLNYTYQYNNVKETLSAAIVVEGNKMTIKMSDKVPTLKDVVLYAFQDADCSQMHFYMHRDAFVNFHTNMQAMLVASQNKQFDITNADAVNAIYDNISKAVQTINVSLVMTKAAK